MTDADRVSCYQISEVKSDDTPVYAVGIGPGNPVFLHPQARSLLDAAAVVIGFETVLDCIDPSPPGEVLACTYDTEANQLSTFADRVQDGSRGVAVLMGDPNVSGYTFLRKVEQSVERSVRIVPGISSIQVAASRARTPLESSIIVTLHKRGDLKGELSRLVRAAGKRNLLVLPRPYDYMPERIAGELTDRGVSPSLAVHVYERLTFPDETGTRTTLAELASEESPDQSAFSDLSVMVVRT